MTHSLAGMLLAEAVCVWRGETRRDVRGAAYLTSALANNLPDIDVAYSWAMGPKPLGNLLHHRGHTHTVLLALLGGSMLGFALWGWFSRRLAAAGARERSLIVGLSLAGPFLHLLMDYGNNYGVHPFWPFYGGWFYGDAIFIMEPLWWVIAMPILAANLTRRWLKLTLWGLLATLVLVCWFVPFVLPASRAAIVGLCAISLAVARYGGVRARSYYAIGGCLGVAALFVGCAAAARAELGRATVAAFPALEVKDLVLTPMPANPTCWEAFVAGEQGEQYRVIRASVALPPLRVEACAAGDDVAPTAPVERLDRPRHGGVHFRSLYSVPVSELRQLRREDCRFRALLRFARLPYVTPPRGGLTSFPAQRYAGDLRYDRDPKLEFADLSLAGACPPSVPGWAEPRADLFQP